MLCENVLSCIESVELTKLFLGNLILMVFIKGFEWKEVRFLSIYYNLYVK